MKGKKLIALIASVVISIGVAVGLTLAISFHAQNQVNTGDGIAEYSKVDFFDDVQYEGENAVMRAWAVGEDFTAITYQIGNGDEVTISTAKTGACNEDWALYENEYEDKRYIDSRVINIDLSELEAGDHIFKVFVYNGEEKETIFKTTFELKASTTSASA